MTEKQEKVIGEWFANRVIEVSNSFSGASLIVVEVAPGRYVNLMLDETDKIVGVCVTSDEREEEEEE